MTLPDGTLREVQSELDCKIFFKHKEFSRLDDTKDSPDTLSSKPLSWCITPRCVVHVPVIAQLAVRHDSSVTAWLVLDG